MWQINPDIRIRPEAGGALVFNPKHAETIYLDREGLSFVKAVFTGDFPSTRFPISFYMFLQKREILVKSEKHSPESLRIVDSLISNKNTPVKNSLSAPETLHIALTNTCDQICAGCFYSRRKSEG
ncbi:MAG: hypothetical protein MUP26_02075, partial [Desulfobulbaceae bacterium]|nr:hypothetical protein [Desulfobulbaceae bacterium]